MGSGKYLGREFQCKYISSPQHKNEIRFFYRPNDETLEYVTTNPYLGITMYDELTWHSHIATIGHVSGSRYMARLRATGADWGLDTRIIF